MIKLNIIHGKTIETLEILYIVENGKYENVRFENFSF